MLAAILSMNFLNGWHGDQSFFARMGWFSGFIFGVGAVLICVSCVFISW
jgi:hypothetical protein